VLGISSAVQPLRMPFASSLMPRLRASLKRRGDGHEFMGASGGTCFINFHSVSFISRGPTSSRVSVRGFHMAQ
jgi:hypothetical protein